MSHLEEAPGNTPDEMVALRKRVAELEQAEEARREAEEALRQREQEFRALVENAADIIARFDRQLRHVYVNPAAARVTGRQAAAFIGKTHQELGFSKTLCALWGDALRKVFATGEEDTLEFEARTRDGGRVFQARLVPEFAPDGSVEHVLSITRDITARVRATERLQFQAHLLDTVEQAVIATIPDGTITYWNRFAERLYGWKAEEALGRNVMDLTLSEPSREDAEAIMERLRAGESWSGEFPVRRRDGTVFPAMVTDTPIYDEAGRLMGIIGVSMDISERKRMEEALLFLAEASKALAASIDYETTLATVARLAVPRLADWCTVDILEDGDQPRRLAIAHVDPDKVETARQLHGRYPPGPDLRRGVANVLRTGQAEFCPDVSDAVLAEAARDQEHLNALRNLGLRSVIIAPLLTRGRILGAITLATAESGRRYSRADLELAEDLARRAALAVENARLYREAQAAVRLREEFLSIAAHEMKTPLTTVKGYAQLLARALHREPLDRERAAGLADHLQGQLNRFELLVVDLLDVSRIQQGRLELRPERMDLSSLAANVLARFEHAPERTPAHQLVLDAPEPVVGTWDPARLDQVLTNIISNALKYSPHGGEVRVAVRETGGWAEVTVRDQGIGMSEADQATLFEPFARGEHASRTATGVGLGFYISSQIVERHGGRITLQSEPGLGSTFVVYLPLRHKE